MSADNDNHFQRFAGKKVIITMKTGETRTGFLVNSGFALTFAPGAITVGEPENIISTTVAS
jgi:flavin reductase (DIM6/NTAB) family NADH-FMN oxidoreductase RutF